jgi:hypothetical protein
MFVDVHKLREPRSQAASWRLFYPCRFSSRSGPGEVARRGFLPHKPSCSRALSKFPREADKSHHISSLERDLLREKNGKLALKRMTQPPRPRLFPPQNKLSSLAD